MTEEEWGALSGDERFEIVKEMIDRSFQFDFDKITDEIIKAILGIWKDNTKLLDAVKLNSSVEDFSEQDVKLLFVTAVMAAASTFVVRFADRSQPKVPRGMAEYYAETLLLNMITHYGISKSKTH